MRRNLSVLCFVATFLLLCFIWATNIRSYYYPSGDEIALITASARSFHPQPLSWIRSGFQDYFLAYASAPPTTDFLRPVANATYFLNSELFGERWSFYQLLTYLVQAGLVAVTVDLGLRRLKLTPKASLLAGLVVLLSPAFGLQEMSSPSFAFDLLASLLVLLGLANLFSRRYASSWFLITLAVFTKETALFAPVVIAFATYAGWISDEDRQRRLLHAAVWLSPVAAWVVLRHLAFSGEGHVYVMQNSSLRMLLKGLVHGFLAWPFGMRTVNQGHGPQLVLFSLNAAFWASLVWIVQRRKSPLRQIPRKEMDGVAVLPLLCACACGSLVLPVALSLPLRFGAIFFPLCALLLSRVSVYATDLPARRWATAILYLLALDGLYQKAVEPVTLASLRNQWRLSASAVAILGQTKAPTVLLFDDASGGFTSVKRLAAFAHYPGRLVRLINIDGIDPGACHGEPRVKVHPDAHGLKMTSDLDQQCAYYIFYSLTPETSVLEHSKSIKDGPLTLTYSLPGVSSRISAGVPQMTGHLEVRVAGNQQETAVMVPNLDTSTYDVITP